MLIEIGHVEAIFRYPVNPDSAAPAPEVLKAVVRVHQNTAGIYGAVTRIGRLAVGQTLFLRAATEKRDRG